MAHESHDSGVPLGPDGKAAWWTGVIYQIYPRSFADSNGDGVGDLKGIASKLPYIRDTLGADCIWISPICPSPMKDYGYDVSDYTDIDPVFGSVEDLEELVEAAHERDLKVILDWVPNHSSDLHAWFIESRSSRDNPKRDWYTWRDPAPDGGPPNNWLSVFGGRAWTFDETTGQYYLHSFLSEQPDLNWRNPELEAAMHNSLRFWLDRGVDGFRVDVAHFLMKDPLFRDNPPAPERPDGKPAYHEYEEMDHVYSKAHDDIYAVHARIRAVVDEYSDRFLVGEIHESDWGLWAKYFGHDLTGFHQPYDFSLIWADWNADAYRDRIIGQEGILPAGAWPNHVLGNHDEPRIATRLGRERVRSSAVLLLTLRGTATVYYGDELGMPDGEIPLGQERDPWGQSHPDRNRDKCRTPMQWNLDDGRGFTRDDVEPWLPFSDRETAVSDQLGDPDSTLTLYRQLIELRHQRQELAVGDITMIDQGSPGVLAFERRLGDASTYVAVNFTDAEQQIALPRQADQLISTHTARDTPFSRLTLAPNEAIVAS